MGELTISGELCNLAILICHLKSGILGQITRENQKVHFGKSELLDESATLSSLSILPGSQLWVLNSGQYENRDIAGISVFFR